MSWLRKVPQGVTDREGADRWMAWAQARRGLLSIPSFLRWSHASPIDRACILSPKQLKRLQDGPH
jgi:hypothetical protein